MSLLLNQATCSTWIKQKSSTLIYKFTLLAQERNDYSRKNKKKKYPNLPASRDQMFDVVLT